MDDSSNRVFTVDAGTGIETPVTTTGLEFGQPSWSPADANGNYRIVYDSFDVTTGQTKLYIVDADGNNQHLLTNTLNPEFRPMWSHDGNRIYFVSDDGAGDGNFDYYESTDGFTTTNVTRHIIEGPVQPFTSRYDISADDSTLVYTDTLGGTTGCSQLMTVSASGGDPTPLNTTTNTTCTESVELYQNYAPSFVDNAWPSASTKNLVALGDSVAAGEGINYGYKWNSTSGSWEHDGPDNPSWMNTEDSLGLDYQNCHQSGRSYADLFRIYGDNYHVYNMACTGASALEDLDSNNNPTLNGGVLDQEKFTTDGSGNLIPDPAGGSYIPPQLGGTCSACSSGTNPYFDGGDSDHHDGHTPDVVTLTLGANDVDFSKWITDCYNPLNPVGCDSQDNTNQISQMLSAEHTNLGLTLTELNRRASDVFHKTLRVLVTNYYNPFPTGTTSCRDTDAAGSYVNAMSTQEKVWLEDHLGDLNANIADQVSYAQHHDSSLDVSLVDLSNVMAGHEWCTTNPWAYGASINFPIVNGSIVPGDNPAPFHPTPEGQHAIYEAVKHVLEPVSASDDFNRADGTLGSGWTDMTDGGLTISGGQVLGASTGNSGDIRTGETYASDQYSQVESTSTQLTGGQWMGTAVRAQDGGQNLYAGIYYWNNGSPVLMMFKRSAGNWAQLGSTYASGALPNGTQLKMTAVGSTLSFQENGVTRITATDTSFTGGSPAIMDYGAPTSDYWTGGDGVGSYTVGGTAFGLTGTVILKNNDGDNLSVSSDGNFTFATPLAKRAAYNVTVATNPLGEDCSVTNGSGTISTANITNVTVSCSASYSTSASDDFNRSDGTLGSNWTDMSDGGLTISGQQVAGTNSGNSGDIRTIETYPDDQYSQIEVTSTQLTGGQWMGPAVRAKNGGQNLYLGIYYWNNGSPDLMLFKRSAGTWTQLGDTYASGALPAGTKLELTAVGSTISLFENGVRRITATDTSFTSGAPAIMDYGTPLADNWTGGNISGTYTVGGTVSGLSGTVVLKNNGGDNLSLNSNGSFTFATSQAPNASYNVTVQSNPSGQICTVTDGSGYISSDNVTNIAVTCQNGSSVSDDFNRDNGTLGSRWTDFTDGGLTISGQQVVGSSSGNSGDIRTAEHFDSDQYSQIEVTSTQLTGGQWMGAAVRAQDNGQQLYLGIYYWNNGTPELMLFKRDGTNWTQLGDTYASGALAAGTQLKLTANGSTLTLQEDGTTRITATDSNYTGGAPAIMDYGTPTSDNWTGGNI